jgi:hypothetical protein
VFGWVDSTGGYFDEDRGKLYRPAQTASVWAATNKARVGRRSPPGGWTQPAWPRRAGEGEDRGDLDSVERLEVPDDLTLVLDGHPPAAANFAAFPPSARKMNLAWVATARRPETRLARITKIAEAAARNERARG